jgi:integrase
MVKFGAVYRACPPRKKLIEVRYQWRCRKNDYDKNGMPILSKKLKTPQSRREIKISTTLAVELAKWKLDHAKNPYAVTTDGKKVQLMFVNSVNRPCSRKDLSKAMSKAIANAHEAGHNLKILDFYSLRHHYASVLIQHALPNGLTYDGEVAYFMGHKDSTVTRKIYAATYRKTESTFDPDVLEHIVEQVVSQAPKPLAEIEPASELLN